MSEIRHKWLDDYFDDRPHLEKPFENMLGYDIPYAWKGPIEKLLAERDSAQGVQKP